MNKSLNFQELFSLHDFEYKRLKDKLAEMVSEYNLALLSCLYVSEIVNENEMYPEAISLLKRNSCSKSLNIARECRDILGGNGITEEYDIFRHMCNLETVKTYEGAENIHSLILGKNQTGIASF